MITDGEKWHFLAANKSYNGDYFCINSKHTKILKQCCKYCYIEIPEKGKNKLKYSHGEKCIKVPFVIYPDTESLLEKINTCHK